jgi:hypothetical protein
MRQRHVNAGEAVLGVGGAEPDDAHGEAPALVALPGRDVGDERPLDRGSGGRRNNKQSDGGLGRRPSLSPPASASAAAV